MTGIVPTLLPRFALLLVTATLIFGLAAWFGVHKLDDERNRLSRLEAMAEVGGRPQAPLMAKGLAFADTERHTAEVRFTDQLTIAANRHRLLVERLKLARFEQDRQALLIADISLSGSEADVRYFAGLIESGKPAIRFANWHIDRTADGEATIRIEARAFALWAPGE